MKKILFFSMLLTMLSNCQKGKNAPKFDKTNFKQGVAIVFPGKGKVLAGHPISQIYGETLVSEGDLVSTGQGEAVVVHENGVKVFMEEGIRLKVQKNLLKIESGSFRAEFPRGIAGNLIFKEWKIRGRGNALTVKDGKIAEAFVFDGEILLEKDGARFLVKAGNSIKLNAKPEISPVKWWKGKDLTQRWGRSDSVDLIPGQGVLGARIPGQKGKAYLPLVISSMNVNVYVMGDMAVTEVRQKFFNPSRNDLEGIYRFQAPEGALVTGFAVDRDSKLVFGKIKGKEIAKQQYTSNVYQGSTQEPALLEWEDDNRYKAFIYPIKAGQKRTILIRYTSWLPRHGLNREFRYYSFPLLGHDDLSPQFNEFNFVVHLGKSFASSVVANLGLRPDGDNLVARESDFRTTSDFNMVLKDSGISPNSVMGLYGRPLGRNAPAVRRNDFVMTRVWPFSTAEAHKRSLDLVILVDMSADNSQTQLNLARIAVESAVSVLKPGDRIAIVSGDLSIRKKRKYLTVGKDDPTKVLEELASEQKGGATDISKLLEETAALFSKEDKGNAPVLLYIGNGRPTVGEMSIGNIANKWFELPYFIGFRAIGTEEGRGFEILKRLSGKNSPMLLTSPSTLRELPAFLSKFRYPRLKHLKVDMGNKMGKMFPLPTEEIEYEGNSPLIVTGQLSEGDLPENIKLTGELDGKTWTKVFKISWGRFSYTKELARRYAKEKLMRLMETGASSEVLMDLGLRYSIVTPFTSLYVPTRIEAEREGLKLIDADDEAEEMVIDGVNLGKKESKKDKDAQKAPSDSAAKTESDKSVSSTRGLTVSDAKTKSLKPGYAMSAPGRPIIAAPKVSEKSSGFQRFGDKKGRRVYKKSAKRRKRRRRSRHYKSKLRSGNSGIGIGGGGGLGGTFGKMPKRGYRGPGKGHGKTGKFSPKEGVKRLRVNRYNGSLNMIRRGRNKSSIISSNNINLNIEQFVCNNCFWKRKPNPCSAVSKMPLWQRRNMWRERLGSISAWKAVEVYNDARRLCEIKGPHSKRVFLRLVVSMFKSVRPLVRFYNKFYPYYGFQTFLRASIIAKIKTVKELLYVKRALGLGRGFQRAKIIELLSKLKSPDEKIALFEKFIKRGDSDPWLKIKLLDLCDEVGNSFKANQLISKLFGNPFLNEELRLVSVEYLFDHKKPVMARRLLSEIVEYSPDNPRRRRLLGRLYEAFGLYKYAVRAYVSLMKLTANSHESMMLLAMAYDESGMFEKSLSLLNKVMTLGDPGSDIVKLARVMASINLARLRIGVSNDKKKVMLQKGRNMAIFRDDESTKIILSYKHPKSDLELLWGESGTRLQRVSFLKPKWGIEGVIASKIPKSLEMKVVRGNPDSKRVLKAELLIIQNEGTAKEIIISKKLKFTKGVKEITLSLLNGKLTVVQGGK